MGQGAASVAVVDGSFGQGAAVVIADPAQRVGIECLGAVFASGDCFGVGLDLPTHRRSETPSWPPLAEQVALVGTLLSKLA